ncbi:RnfABCDGE type electron transport complex subunit D [Rhodophyticola porphyridii]|uniref:RnfABCDGE type electron transport complex subunit D n=1 Tax=Rhodophyticola porphyridii TaxID=1852017 RepID=UPI001B29F1D7|nr:RnfABCDGE type electron transport complex subunit D [Roseicyclus sp.]MBO6625210.1 RnfABCDGE type electron transport complex subunit D [Roseicyclus sp.]MBO6923690.1 RnfABCDGE type electron transport complex subunit D [Roseicyclus sp.]
MIRGLWNRETVALMLLAAYLPLALFWLWLGGTGALAQLALAVLVIGIWHLVFMLLRAQAPSLVALTTALAIAMLAPEDLGTFRLVLGVSFGVVMGELVFGGWGRNVVNPAIVALSFLGFGFPAFPWPVFDAPIAWAAIPAALIGVASGAMPAAVLAGAALVATGAVLTGLLPEQVLLAAGIVLVLLVADPVTSAATTLGRWINGALYAGLVTFFAIGWAGAAPVQIAVAAALLTSLAAPLLDEAALALWVAQRRRRHGRT